MWPQAEPGRGSLFKVKLHNCHSDLVLDAHEETVSTNSNGLSILTPFNTFIFTVLQYYLSSNNALGNLIPMLTILCYDFSLQCFRCSEDDDDGVFWRGGGVGRGGGRERRAEF